MPEQIVAALHSPATSDNPPGELLVQQRLFVECQTLLERLKPCAGLIGRIDDRLNG